MPRQSQEISQQQQLRQRLNPRQVALGRMLEMSAPEFEDEVRRVLDENPALELADTGELHQPIDDFNESAEEMQRNDYADPDDIPSYRLNAPAGSPEDISWRESNDADDSESGFSRLERQLDLIELTPVDRAIATYIIGNIDSNGYLTRKPEAIADDIAISTGLDIERSDVERVMEVVRSLEPAGICAIDLRDCLLLQLDRMDKSREDVADAREIIDRYFDIFSNRRFDKLRAATGLSRQRIEAATKLITSLDPKPGTQLEGVGSDDRTRHITPDFTVDTSPEGEVSITLAGRIPELTLDKSFMLEAPGAADDAFIKARREEATDFINVTRRRGETLMAVMEAIVKLQPAFFSTYDRSQLQPMVLRDIKRLTGLDLSVISRATAGKYVATPHGIFSLKSLFSEGSGEGGDTSSHAISEALREIVDSENPAAPLSDQELQAALASRGIDLARRTVTKYRERLNIPPARLRRNN
ncbi:MAG: RNA polymerase factor sigma-54 [Muribaculaceae bacterium]|nr:RNA polymerase factor sigma-54 [Muribaculaceae bacterium]